MEAEPLKWYQHAGSYTEPWMPICCDEAERRYCVCTAYTVCKTHGEIHRGTHD